MFLTLIVREEVLIIALSLEILFSTVISPVAGIELIEESDIPIESVFDPHPDNTSAVKSETIRINFFFNLSPIRYTYILSLCNSGSKLHTSVNLET
jgi:hypothetical protein